MTGASAASASAAAIVPVGTGRAVLGALLKPYATALLGLLLLLAGQSLVTLVNPWLAGRFAAAVLAHAPVQTLLGAWFGLIALQCVLAWAIAVRTQHVTASLVADLGNRVFDHLQMLPLRWHQERPHGETLALLTQDVPRLGQFLTGTLTPLLPLLLTCLGALAMMALIAPWFAMAAAALVPAMFVLMRLAGRRLRPLGRQVIDGMAEKSALAGQHLSLLPLVKAYTGESDAATQYADASRALRDQQLELGRLSALIAPAVRLLSAAAILLLLGVASRDVAGGGLQPAELVSLLLYGLLLTQPVSALAGVYGQWHVARGTAQRLDAVLQHAREPDSGRFVPAKVRGELRFEGVCYQHAGRPPVLDGLDLDLRAGETIAITGVNGAGKSTLVHLLLRFADPDRGRILFDGRDLREYALGALRAHIGLVSQQVLLFDAAVGDNIAYGRRDASQGDIEAAARLAQAHDFIAALPQGYATRVGDRGVKLSGGQRQRVALARALLKQPALLILDEATAMFDPDAERGFVQACRDRPGHGSLILITHRPASLALADRVLRLTDGRLHAV